MSLFYCFERRLVAIPLTLYDGSRLKKLFNIIYKKVLANTEKESLWSKFLAANISNMFRVSSRGFTEQGVYMLAIILKSKEAINEFDDLEYFDKMLSTISIS